MDPHQVLDALLHGVGQIVVGGPRVQEEGVAAGAGRRGLHAQQQRPLGRHGVERAVGVEPLGPLGEVLTLPVVGDDVPLRIEIARREQLRRHAAGRTGVLGPTRDLERPEGPAEADLLRIGDLGVPNHQDAVTRHGRLDDVHELLCGRLGQVGPHQLGGEERVQRVHLHTGLHGRASADHLAEVRDTRLVK